MGDRCAIALRFSVDEMLGPDGISCDNKGHNMIYIVVMLANLPDLWDVNVSNFSNDGQTSRFSEESFQEDYVWS